VSVTVFLTGVIHSLNSAYVKVAHAGLLSPRLNHLLAVPLPYKLLHNVQHDAKHCATLSCIHSSTVPTYTSAFSNLTYDDKYDFTTLTLYSPSTFYSLAIIHGKTHYTCHNVSAMDQQCHQNTHGQKSNRIALKVASHARIKFTVKVRPS
jgi:hypothetical protein